MGIYYKLLTPELTSISAISSRQDGYVLYYKVDQWIEPTIEGSALFVFKKMKHLNNFLNEYPIYKKTGCVIWLCETKGYFRQPPFAFKRRLLNKILYLRKKKKNSQLVCKNGYITRTPPIGTLGVKMIKLIRKVKEL